MSHHPEDCLPFRKTPGLFTPKERQVVAYLLDGCGNRDIAEALGVSVETVKRHLSNICDKTGMSTRLEVVLFCLRHGELRIVGGTDQTLDQVVVLKEALRAIVDIATKALTEL